MVAPTVMGLKTKTWQNFWQRIWTPKHSFRRAFRAGRESELRFFTLLVKKGQKRPKSEMCQPRGNSHFFKFGPRGLSGNPSGDLGSWIGKKITWPWPKAPSGTTRPAATWDHPGCHLLWYWLEFRTSPQIFFPIFTFSIFQAQLDASLSRRGLMV